MKRLAALLVSLSLLAAGIPALAEEPAALALLPDASVYAAETVNSTIDAFNLYFAKSILSTLSVI